MTRALALVVVGVVSLSALASCGGGGGGGIATDHLVTLNTAAIPGGTTGSSYVTAFDANFIHPPGVFLLTGGSLPPGLELDTMTGELTGFPRQVGSFHFEIAARDGVDPALPAGRDSSFAEARGTFAINVSKGPPQILPQTIPAAQYRSNYQYQIDFAGGTAPYTFTQIGGSLPTGLTVSPAGILGNFPTQAVQHPYTFEVLLTDANGLTDSEVMTVDVVVLPLIILTNALPQSAQGFPYDVPLTLASAGAGAPYTWSQAPLGAGEVALSSIGMEISSDGHVRQQIAFPGPTAAGIFKFTAQVTDEALQTASRQLTLQVNPGPAITNINPKQSSAAGPFTVTGANFQPGAKLEFKPGPNGIVITPTFVSPTTLTFNTSPPAPLGGGVATVRVKNPDGGFADLTNGFVFPFANLSFGAKGYIASGLSSTGLDAADVTGDGLADVVHCGSNVIQNYSGGIFGTSPGLHFLKNLGGLAFATTTLDTGSFSDVLFVDVNVDGKLDIVALGSTVIKTWINNPLGTFTPGPTSSLPGGFTYAAEMRVAYLNAGLVPDLMFSVAQYSNPSGAMHAMTGDGTGGFSLLSSATATITSTYGVVSFAAVDVNGDGISDCYAGSGFNPGAGPVGRLSTSSASGAFGSWPTLGTTGINYGNTLGVCAADFLGTGAPAVIALHSQDAADGAQKQMTLFTGTGLSTITNLTATSTQGKCINARDLDLDGKADWAVSTHLSSVAVYRGSTKAQVQSMDANSGSPTIANARTGRIAFGDLDGDGRIDVLATTSYWATDYQPYLYGATYALNFAGNSSNMGVVFWLNSSN